MNGGAARRFAGRRHAFGLIGVDALSIDVGAELYPLLAPPNCEALLDRIGDVRRALAAETGIVIPGVRLRDDPLRDPRTYALRVRDRVVVQGIVRLDLLLAVAAPEVLAAIGGEATTEPVYGLQARWIRARRARARAAARRADVRRDLHHRFASGRGRARARGGAVRPPGAADADRAPARLRFRR